MCKYFIILLHVISSFTSGERGDIILDIDRGLWLNDRDFEMMIKYSYHFSTCCNIFVNGTTRDIGTLFNLFIKIYQYEYTTGSIEYGCRGFFLLGSTGETLALAVGRVPTAVSTTEILIVVDADLRDDSPLLNVSLFQHSNVNIIARSGNWTLSENFLQPRMFKKVHRSSQMRHKTGIVDLEGRRLQVTTSNIAPFSYLSTTVNRTVNGIQGQFFVANDERELDGVEVKLFLIMAEKLNFTWMMRKPNGPYRHGRPNGTSWNGGMIGQLYRKEVDLAFGEVWLEYEKSQYVNLSVPWYEVWINFLVPRPKPTENVWALAKPFRLNVWVAVIAIVILESIAVWGKARINSKLPPRFRSYVNTLIEVIGRLVGTWAPRKTQGIRIQLQFWHFAGLLVVTAYSSSLAARLTTPDYEPRIDTIAQFVKANLTWGRERTPPNYRHYFDLNDPYAKQLSNGFLIETSQEDRQSKILEGNYAIIGKISHSIFFPEVNVCNSDLANYRVMRESTAKFFISFGAQSWLVPSIDTMMRRLTETGLVEYHLRDVIRRRVNGSLRDVFIEHDGENTNGPRALKLKPLGAAFIILLAGYVVATIILYFELKNKNKIDH
ncbi:glutamate receptor ionotropic, delta-2 [Diachasma alloeum]|uniref:Ionotropic receptor 122 n=1 Tax=Diachasma alloeum TaxID=454923 RepID=A0A4E0RNG4_9HYME|nr:glutamate receptor ionotropic, delta-2 [Diachasma alloeum]THK32956.1 ionotropic receptor 122 [Diachasma alloeum]